MKVSLAGLVLMAGYANAQGVSAVYVTAPQVRLISATAVQLSAIARDPAGNMVSVPVTWSSNAPAVVTVDSSGMAMAGSLGMADVVATAGGRQGILRLQVLPKRIAVSPAETTVSFGAQQQFTAVAYDSQDQPIPNAAFTWRVLVGGGTNDSSTVPVTKDGMVSGKTLGYYVVRASVLYPNIADQFEREFAGSTTFRIVPADYRSTPLVSSSNSYPSFHIRGKRGNSLAVNQSGQLAFASSLDGVTSALMSWRQGAPINVLATTGTAGLVPGTIFWDFDSLSMDTKGNVLATASCIGSGVALVLASSSGTQILVPDRSVADSVLDVTNMALSRSALSDSGQAVFRANFHYYDSTVNYSGILRYVDGDLVLEASSKDPLPGLTGLVSFDNEFGIDGAGVIYFSASAGSGRAIYRKELFKAPVKIIALGDTINGAAVTQLVQVVVAQAGDLVVRASLATGAQVLLRYPGGATNAPPLVGSTNFVNALYGTNATGGTVWYGDAGPGSGLNLWTADGNQRLMLRQYAASPGGEPILDFYSAGVDGSGSVYAAVRGADTPWILMNAGSPSSMIASNGTAVGTSANLDVYQTPVIGDRVGPLHVLAGGNQPSIFKVAGHDLIPSVLLGDRLPGGFPYQGNFFPRKSPSGDLYVTADNATIRLSVDGASSLVATYPLPLSDGVNMGTPFNLAANDHNQAAIIASTDHSHQRLVIADGTTAKTIAYFNGSAPYLTTSPAGGTFGNLNDLSINESGQVLISASVNGGPSGLFLYDGTAWQSACIFGSCKVDAETILSASTLRMAGNRFCALMGPASTNTLVACLDDGTWTNFAQRGQVTSDGTEMTNLSTYDVNRKGDIAIVANTNLGGPNVFLRSAGAYYTVASAAFPPEAGDFLVNTYSVDLRDDRRVFFVTQDYFGRMVTYEADPQF